ncbi:very short patch repair endonuclease [Geosporobacter ferrireducens]|uniref:Very short patch repair endonuclease n=1 Tax=Geosporobacter ferrireducens TaxID=1424294 RepID=A0A1D8GLV7_9FIRM|nr:DNA mismatch endonuclease Vsr [Geosporobacter ferrireducens]AOT71908.1 hypothetical protein Gferi_21640 [Geosporobacter ferrireducens]MTI55699.1 DNA mismatch endonuclease Vsr [Geosporobacter ferrireducens]
MADVFTKEKRSEVMSKIRSKDTKIEVLVRKWLFAHGFRFRKNDNRYPGKPDIVLPKYKTVIFVHGCFWHGHENCKVANIPKTRTDFWLSKINRNKEKDVLNTEALRKEGWNVIIIWECELKKNPEQRLANLREELFRIEKNF